MLERGCAVIRSDMRRAKMPCHPILQSATLLIAFKVSQLCPPRVSLLGNIRYGSMDRSSRYAVLVSSGTLCPLSGVVISLLKGCNKAQVFVNLRFGCLDATNDINSS